MPTDPWDEPDDDVIEQGNIDLARRPHVKNQDGSVSTVRSLGVNIDGQEVLIPTVVGDRVVSDDEAIAHYKATGEHLGKFKSPEAATRYAEQLHEQQADTLDPWEVDDEPMEFSGDEVAPVEPPSPRSVGDALLAGARQNGIPFTGQVSAAFAAAPDILSRRQGIVESYKAQRAAQLQRDNQAAHDHPIAYAVGGLPGTVATALAAGAAVPAEIAATYGPKAAATLADFGAAGVNALANGGNAAVDVLAGNGIAAVGRAAMRPLRSIGNALQGPQKVVDKVANVVGGEGMDSARVRELKRTSDVEFQAGRSTSAEDVPRGAKDLPTRIAEADLKGTANIGQTGAEDVHLGNEFGDDLWRMQRDASQEALESRQRFGNFDETPLTAATDRAHELQAAGRGQEATDLFADIAAAKKRAASTMQGEMDYTLSRARELRDAIAMQQRSAALGREARDELGRIERGRERIGKATWVPGRMSMGAIDVAGGLGQKLAEAAPNIEKWAMREDWFGDAVRKALTQDADTAMTRIAILSDFPEAQSDTQ